MPRIFGLNLVGVLVASIAFFMVGWLWYGVLFMDAWMQAQGISAADAEAESPLWMLGGLVITIMQVIGIGLVLKWKNVSGLVPSVMAAVTLWVFFALPFCGYAYIYAAHNSALLLIDASHLLAGWVVSAVVLSLIK